MKVPLGDTYYKKFTTRQFSTGAPFTLAGTPVLSVYEENNLTQITAGVSVTVDYDTVTGLNEAAIVATTGNGYEVGKYYDIVRQVALERPKTYEIQEILHPIKAWLDVRTALAAPDEVALFVSRRGRRLSTRSVQSRLRRRAIERHMPVHVLLTWVEGSSNFERSHHDKMARMPGINC